MSLLYPNGNKKQAYPPNSPSANQPRQAGVADNLASVIGAEGLCVVVDVGNAAGQVENSIGDSLKLYQRHT